MAPSSFLALLNNPILLLLLLASLPSRHDAFSTSLIRVEPWQQGGGISARISVTIASRSTVSLSASTSDDGGEDEEHLRGIGVGIDLGTTNSAVAMMVPTDADGDGGSIRRTLPTMIEIDHGDGSNTIPSVVAFIPSSDVIIDGDCVQQQKMLSLPPWSEEPTTADDDGTTLEWPSSSSSSYGGYQIYIGKDAIEYEQSHPTSTYRNVKRIIGTGGKMAELASGLVPNLFIQSIHGEADAGTAPSELDALFDFLEESDKKKKSKNNTKNKKGKKKWNKKKKKKQSELPKLHNQLEDAKDDPALLTCNMNLDDNDEATTREVLLRPEQISACILRKLYDTAEQYHNSKNEDRKENNKVTRAVIGVPAYFTEAQRQATIRASELAGVPKVKLLPEPEAAALAYGSASQPGNNNNNGNGYNDKEELILVFDLGGGTFDVSILEVGAGVTEVLATVGNNRLGGTDFDRRVAEFLSMSAVEFGRKQISLERKRKRDAETLDDAQQHGGSNTEEQDGGKTREKRKRGQIKDWYRHGSGEVPDIILRVAEEARKSLSNQKVIDVLVPLTEDGWRQIGGSGSSEEDGILLANVIGPFDKVKLESELDLYEDEDYTIISLDRKTFESICHNELQMLLKPIREVAIMAGVLLPGEARPSFVENAMAMAMAREEAQDNMMDGEDFWDFEYEDEEDEDVMLIKTDKDGVSVTDSSAVEEEDEEALNEQALEQIQAMDIKAQKKAQQRGRKKARDVAKRERSYRKQKQSAMEEATTASLLGQQLGGGSKANKQKSASAPQIQPTSVSVGNERVQEGIHGRPLSRIVLVGGATRMPVIAKLLDAVAGMVPQRTVHPDEAVALGCAVQAGILDGENDGLMGGSMQAVLSPMQAAVMRALAKKRGMTELMDMEDDEFGFEGDDQQREKMMMGGISGMMIVDKFDDEDDFY